MRHAHTGTSTRLTTVLGLESVLWQTSTITRAHTEPTESVTFQAIIPNLVKQPITIKIGMQGKTFVYIDIYRYIT